MEFVAGRCAPSDRARALAILYQHLPEHERSRQIESILSSLDGSPSAKDLEGLLCCNSEAGVVGAMLCLQLPGRVAMGWPPRVLSNIGPPERDAILRSLLQSAKHGAVAARARFLQLLLDDVPAAFELALVDAGFVHLTRLLYVRRPIHKHERWPAPRQGLEFVPYREELLPSFLDVLDRSYDGSLDCPELNGVRHLEDVLASHRGPGPFDPESWFLVRNKEGWCGCLLLTAAADRSIEVAYLAVLGPSRGRGLGKELTRHALRHAVARKLDAVVLAVDSRNWPALAMYEAEGFLPWDAREVYLALLDPANAEGIR